MGPNEGTNVHQPLVILDRATIDGATDLLARFGTSAELEAASRAARSRDLGNIAHFCRWRQIERIIACLSDREVTATVH